MLFQGTLDRFPGLNFIVSEAGIGWIPYLMARLDDHYLEYGYDMPYLDDLPSKYICDQFYFTTQPLGHTPSTSSHIAHWLEMIGPDCVMYSADLPHADFDPPEELFERISGRLDSETVEYVMGKTAKRLYDL